jgi:23S rRNA pseudouridine955/2504/2580 synthase/23S rRNA pseudouridine1911/1915/1917 synthase
MMRIEDSIIFEDEHIVVLNKPAGILTIPDREGKDPSLKGMLKHKYGNIFTVHRLDRETSGIVVFAKHEESHKVLSQQFEGRDIEKYYQGIVMGKPMNTEGSIDAPLMDHPVKKGMMVANRKGKPSLTDYTVLESFKSFSWMQFRIHTGRMHQIRVHMKEIGHPLACDELYGDGKPIFISTIKRNYNLSKDMLEERPILNRLALHSWKLKFRLYEKTYELEAEPPKDIRALLQQLKKNKK